MQEPERSPLTAEYLDKLLHAFAREPVDGGRCVDVPPFRMVLDYGYDAALRSVEDSLQRLGMGHVDVALIHDLDRLNFAPDVWEVHFRTAMDGAFRALSDLRAQGVVGAVGLGVNEWQACRDALAHGVLVTGATVFLVDAGVDTGEIIAQEPVRVLPGDDEATLHERIKVVERDLLVDTVNRISRGNP